MKKKLVLAVCIVLIVAVSVTAFIVIKGNDRDYMKNEQTVEFISTAIRSLKDSIFSDRELIKNIYTVAFSDSAVISENFPEKLEDTLPALLNGTAYDDLLKSVVYYGGKSVKGSINGIATEPTYSLEENELYVGDLLFIKNGEENQYFIYDKGGLVNLSKAVSGVNTSEVLTNAVNADIFAVFRMMKVMDYDFLTDNSTEDLNKEQEAVVVTAKSFLLRGSKLQYADTRLGADVSSEYRWKAGFFAPEDYTSDFWGYTNCAAFTYDVYYNALGIDLHNGDRKLYTTYNQTDFSDALGIRKYYMECETADFYTDEMKEEIKEEILETLQPADILVVRRNGNGHSMLYIGNGNIIHSSGSVYNYNEAKENYEASIRQMRFEDYFFKEGASGYIFGSDTGKNVSTFAILRPLDTFEGDIPEVTQNRVKNMQGIMAQKLSTANIAKTVNAGDEITFTFDVYNTNDTEKTVDILDVVPQNTAYVGGCENVNGNNLSWKLTIPANTRKTVSYTVRVNSNSANGDKILSQSATVGGVPVRCADITIGRTLTNEEQDKIANAIKNIKNSSKAGFELVNEIYKNALGKNDVFSDTDFNFVTSDAVNGVFYGYGSIAQNGYGSYQLNTDGKNPNMLVPTLYGGRSYARNSWGNRTRLPRELNLVAGDVLVRKTTIENQIFIYAGDGKLYNLTNGFAEDNLTLSKRLETTIATGRFYAVLRPSLSFN